MKYELKTFIKHHLYCFTIIQGRVNYIYCIQSIKNTFVEVLLKFLPILSRYFVRFFP